MSPDDADYIQSQLRMFDEEFTDDEEYADTPRMLRTAAICLAVLTVLVIAAEFAVAYMIKH